MGQSTTKHVAFEDKSYIEKRKILRQLSTKDEISIFLDIVTDSIFYNINCTFNSIDGQKIIKILDYKDLDFLNIIRNFLIDGYLSFKIENDKLDVIDPYALFGNESESKLYSRFTKPISENEIGNFKEILQENNIIYLIYPNNYKISYVGELKESYEKLKKVEMKLFSENNNKINLKILKWLNLRLNMVSRIPESMINDTIPYTSGTSGVNLNRRYDNFISRISNIFKKELLSELLKKIN